MSKFERILAEFADGFINGSTSIADLIEKYQVRPGSELEMLLLIADELQHMLTPVEPSQVFVDRLRRDLLNDEENATLVKWLRHLSAKQQLAAGIGGLTVAAGLYFIARRTSFDWRLRRADIRDETPKTSSALAS